MGLIFSRKQGLKQHHLGLPWIWTREWRVRQGFKHRGPWRRQLSEKTLRSPESPFGHRRGFIGCSAAVPLKWSVPVAESSRGMGLPWLSQFASRFCAAAAAASCNAMTSTVGRLKKKEKRDTMAIVPVNNDKTKGHFAASESSRLPVRPRLHHFDALHRRRYDRRLFPNTTS